jgi:hypothetical protein
MMPDWLWELDKHLNEVALDIALSALVAAGVTLGLRFLFETL